MKTLPNNIFGMGHVGVSKYNPGIMKFMQMATIFGAGGFGLIHLFKPDLLKTLLGAPQNSLMLGDMFVGSVFTAFGLAALFTYICDNLDEYAVIASFQGTYKFFWCVAFIVHYSIGAIELNLFNNAYFAIMLIFVIGDALGFKLIPQK